MAKMVRSRTSLGATAATESIHWEVEGAMDTRSAGVLGICIIIAALVVALLPRSMNSETGRYQLVRSSGVNCFVLDTKTGRLWQRFVESSGGPSDWSENKTPWLEAQSK